MGCIRQTRGADQKGVARSKRTWSPPPRNDHPPSAKKLYGSLVIRERCRLVNLLRTGRVEVGRNVLVDSPHDLGPGQVDSSLRDRQVARVEPLLDTLELTKWNRVDVLRRSREVGEDEYEIELLETVLDCARETR